MIRSRMTWLESIDPGSASFGAISDYKLDLELLEESIPPSTGMAAGARGSDRRRRPGHAGGSPRRDCPTCISSGRDRGRNCPATSRGFDVCLLPNRLNRYTRHMFPLKFFEYLSAGKPVVMTPLPSLEAFRHLALCGGREHRRLLPLARACAGRVAGRSGAGSANRRGAAARLEPAGGEAGGPGQGSDRRGITGGTRIESRDRSLLAV